MTVRKAAEKDFDEINNLFYELDTHAIDMQPEHFQRGMPRSFEYLSGLISDDKSDILLALIDDLIIGFSIIVEKETPKLDLLIPHGYAYIQDFVISESHRNKGFGAKLMEASKKWAKDRGLTYLRLSVLPENKDARRFYKRQDMKEQMITMECPI